MLHIWICQSRLWGAEEVVPEEPTLHLVMLEMGMVSSGKPTLPLLER